MYSFEKQYNIKYYSPYFWIGQCTQSYTEESKKTAFFYSPFKLKLMPSVSNSNNEFITLH